MPLVRRYNSLLEEPQRLANFLSQRLGELGLAVSTYPLEEEEYNLALRSGQYDLVLRLESWPWVDPATELNLSWAWAPGLNRLYNPANYYSNRLSLLGEGARFVGLQAEREAAYAEVQEKLAQDGVALNLAWTEIYHGCGLKVANLVSIETVSSVDIEIDGENYTMDLSDQENGNYKLNGTKADKEEVSSLYTELISIFIEKEIEDQNAERDTTEPIMTFTFHRNIEEAPDIVESFYKYEKDYAAVNINGTEFFLADIASVNDLADTIEEAFK